MDYDYRTWGLIIFILLVLWLVARTFRNKPDA